MSNSETKDLVHQLILIFSDSNRVQLDDRLMTKINKLNKDQLLNAVETIDREGRIIAYSCIKNNLI